MRSDLKKLLDEADDKGVNPDDPRIKKRVARKAKEMETKGHQFTMRDLLACAFTSHCFWLIVGICLHFGLTWLAVPTAAIGVWSSWVSKDIYTRLLEARS